MKNYRKKDGFTHEKILVLPSYIIDNIKTNKASASLYVTDIGYFPYAKNHYRKREEGCSNYILIVCVDGTGYVELNGETIRLEKYNYIIIENNIPHVYYADNYKPWSIYWIHFNGDFVKEYLKGIVSHKIYNKISPLGMGCFIQYFNDLYRVLKTGYYSLQPMTATNLLGVLLMGLQFPIIYDNQESETYNKPIEICINIMKNQLNKKLTLEELSKKANMSKSYLITLFKEQTGYTPMNYFIHLKVQKACNLLDTTTLSVSEIGERVGYQDPFYFSRIFKKTIGMSPKNYKQIEKG